MRSKRSSPTPDDVRVPPHNLEAEQSVLGTFLLSDGAAAAVHSILSAEDFYDPRHQEIFRAVLDLTQSGCPTDALTLINELERKEILEKIGGPDYVTGLEQYVINPANVLYHARIVQEKSTRRRLIRAAAEISDEAYAEADDLQTILGHAEQRTYGLLTGNEATSTPPRCLSARDFLASPRPPLEYHIDGILPAEGKLTFSATSKFGKSMWAMQTGLALAAGNCDWLGWHFGPPARVLYMQAEIMDALVSARLAALLRQLPPQIDGNRAVDGFAIQEIANHRPNLLDLRGRGIAEAMIQRHAPQVLILDPLAAICPGLEENDAGQMSLALNYFAELTRKFSLAVILVHHHGKAAAGVSRGSSVFEAWPESDLSAQFVSESDHSTARVDMRLRCIYNSGPAFWSAPTEHNLWFSVMPSDFTPPPKPHIGRQPKIQPNTAALAIKTSDLPGLSHTNLTTAIMAMTGCSQRTARTAVLTALENHSIKYQNGLYIL